MSSPLVMSRAVVASGLAPRWGAQRPHYIRRVISDKPQCVRMGLLRSPTRGKPARHKEPASQNNPTFHMKPTNHNQSHFSQEAH
jgi:hypothetical protein